VNEIRTSLSLLSFRHLLNYPYKITFKGFKLKILVIDDEAEYRTVLRDFLEMKGFNVEEANNGEEALIKINHTQPNLIISDINMPGMNGEVLYQKIQETGSIIGTIPFIFLSGNLDDNESIKWLTQGVHYCFQKPVKLSYLVAHIHSIFQNANRINKILEKQMEKFSGAFPNGLRNSFPRSSLLGQSIEDFASFTLKVVKQLHVENKSDTIPTVDQDPHNPSILDIENLYIDEFRILKLYSDEYEKRQSLVLAPPIENLSWNLIFLVAKADFSSQKIYVSDLYISFNASKSTVNERINSLIIDNVFQKSNHPDDKRRLMVNLTDKFKHSLTEHIKNNIEMVRLSFI